jgi:Transposase DDE domain
VTDSQSVKTTESGRPRGYDAAKKLKGRKRHVVTDTSGPSVGIAVHRADIQNLDAAGLVIETIHDLFPWPHHLFADSVWDGPNLHNTCPVGCGRRRGRPGYPGCEAQGYCPGLETLPIVHAAGSEI